MEDDTLKGTLVDPRTIRHIFQWDSPVQRGHVVRLWVYNYGKNEMG